MTATLETPHGFTLEGAAGGRIRITWTNPAGRQCTVIADFDGERLTKVIASGFRQHPTVVVTSPKGGRGSTGYENAEDAEYGPVIAGFAKVIEAEGLASKILALAAQDRADREAAQVASKAAIMRRELDALNILGGPSPTELAAAYDRIQNSTW